MATISKMAAYVTANISGFTAGMREAGGEAEGFGSRFKSVTESVLSAAAILGVGLSAEGIVDYLKQTGEAIEANSRLSIALGVSTQALGRLQYAANITGVSTETLNSGLTKMLKNIDAARDGSKSAVEGFDKLGLSAKDFVGLSADQAFAKIADSITHAKDQAAAMHAAIDILGKQAGAELIPLLAQGSQGLNALGDEAEKTGNALNDIQSAQVDEAGEAFRKLQAQIQGAANLLVVQLSPYLTAIADKLGHVADSGGGMGKIVVGAFESVVKGIAYATDYLELLVAGWDTMKAGAEYAIAGIQFGLEKVVEGISKILSWLGVAHDGFDQFAEDVKKSHEDMMKDAGAAWDDAQKHVDDFASGTNSAAVASFFDGIKSKSQDAAKSVADAHAKMEALGKIVAGDDEAGGSKKKSAIDKMAEDAKKLYEETRTPLEKFQEKIDDINGLYAAGKIDIDTYSRSLNKAEDDLEKATKAKEKFHHVEVDGPKLLQAGSADAASFVAKFQAQQKENEHEKALAATAKQQLAVQKAQLKAMESASFLQVISAGGIA